MKARTAHNKGKKVIWIYRSDKKRLQKRAKELGVSPGALFTYLVARA